MKERIKTTSFWLGLSGVLVIMFECISKIFSFSIGSEVVQDICFTIGSVLVVLGFITKKNVSDKTETSKQELLDEFKNCNKDDER